MKRFYRAVDCPASGPDFTVTLDGSLVKTPAGRPLLLPAAALAAAVAGEWRAQGERILPASMPLSQLVCTALDRTQDDRGSVVATLQGFGHTDLLCHRARHPQDLAARQADLWQPWLDWAAATWQIRLQVTEGVLPIVQPAHSLAQLRCQLERYDHWRLTALQSAVAALGSVILGLALVERRISAAAAVAASQLDELFQAERWGSDAEAVLRRARQSQDVDAAARLIALLPAMITTE